MLHSPDHQRDAWGPHAQFARRPATATLGIADEPGTLGDPGGGEGGTSFAKLVLQCFLCFQLGGPCLGGLLFDIFVDVFFAEEYLSEMLCQSMPKRMTLYTSRNIYIYRKYDWICENVSIYPGYLRYLSLSMVSPVCHL